MVLEDLLEEGLRERKGGWWEVDAHQLLKAGKELTLEVGNLLERTGDGGEKQSTTQCYALPNKDDCVFG